MKFRGPARLPGRPDRARAPLPRQYLDSRDLSGACYSIWPIESTLRPRHPVGDGLRGGARYFASPLGLLPAEPNSVGAGVEQDVHRAESRLHQGSQAQAPLCDKHE